MLLDLKELFAVEGAGRDFDYEIDLSGYELSRGEYPLGKVAVNGRVENRVGVVLLRFHTSFVYRSKCDRCERAIAEPTQYDFSFVLVSKLEGEGSDDMVLVENKELDLDELVTSNIVLNLPMKHLCKTGCKGLCPICGKDLNEGVCGCVQEDTDPRLEALKKLID